MYKNIKVEAENLELIIENSHGDKAIIPANKRNWVKQKLSEGCHSCIDSLVETLPVMEDYAQDGGIYPTDDKGNPTRKETYTQWGERVKKLAPNLDYTKDDGTYNYRGAYEGGLEPDWVDQHDEFKNNKPAWAVEKNGRLGAYHLGSRNPKTGEILKSKNHPTFNQSIQEDAKMGYIAYEKDGKVYTIDRKSQEYRDLYNSGRLMSYDKNTDTYIAPPLKEVTITAEAPQWLKYKREYEKNNPKSDYINQYLNPFARSLGNTETNYPKRLDDEYDNNLYSSYIDKLYNDFSFEFSDKEQELVDKYSKTERDKSAYKYFKEKNQDKKWQEEYLEATKDIAFDTFIDQLPDIASKYRNNPYIDKVLKLPHVNKLMSGYKLLYEGKPLTAISELIKIPKFSSITSDALINILQENPEGYDLKNLEDKYLSPVRLAGIKNEQIMSDIGKEIIKSGETKNSSWKSREFNLPNLSDASKKFQKKYNVSQNEFVEFIENYMVGRNKTYKETLEAYDKYLQLHNK